MIRHFLVFLLAVVFVLTSCSKNTKHETPTGDSLGFHTSSSAYVREDKDSWTYVTENGSFHYTEVLRKARKSSLTDPSTCCELPKICRWE
jgi:hypothetical protein